MNQREFVVVYRALAKAWREYRTDTDGNIDYTIDPEECWAEFEQIRTLFLDRGYFNNEYPDPAKLFPRRDDNEFLAEQKIVLK